MTFAVSDHLGASELTDGEVDRRIDTSLCPFLKGLRATFHGERPRDGRSKRPACSRPKAKHAVDRHSVPKMRADLGHRNHAVT